MRLLWRLILCSPLLIWGASIDKKIEQKKKELSSTQIEYNKMDKKLSGIAEKIIDAKNQRETLEGKLTTLETSIKKNQSEFDRLNQKQSEVSKGLVDLKKEVEEKKEKFVGLVANKFSMALVLEEMKQPTSESVMLQEIYGVYVKENDYEIELLKTELEKLKTKETYFLNKQENIKRMLGEYNQEREEYQVKKDQQNKVIDELARDQAIYKKRFDTIRQSRRTLEKKLEELKILKRDQSQERRTQAPTTQGTSSAQAEVIEEEPPTQVGKYRGGKTISPLAGSKLIKKFGSYVDPIYKFKIFNKSITLKAPYKDAKVKTVLNGKVVFAEDSGGMLGRVVIIEHSNKLHTIYAKLSRLAPGIHVGKQVAKGSVIGKVNSTLMFEVTKDNRHINPLQLITL